ncbi:germin-like protein subfamily 1 member 10 [Quercus suber]|uniref:Germin-like protein n=1 Tax=Quercus suber TaxID=58331 RepID=A0AAW0LUE1_QUESU
MSTKDPFLKTIVVDFLVDQNVVRGVGSDIHADTNDKERLVFKALSKFLYHLYIRFSPNITCYCPLLQNFLICDNNKFFCVVFVNGKFCKYLALVTINDFFFFGFNISRNIGFVTSNPNKLFTKVLNKGYFFIFPIGLLHFQFNIWEVIALTIASLSSQKPKLITMENVLFGSNPPINSNVLIKAFQLDKSVVDSFQK